MHVREATPEDAPAVRRVATASWHAAHDDALGTEPVDELLAQWYDVGRSFYDDHGFELHEERTVELAGESVDDVVLVREL